MNYHGRYSSPVAFSFISVAPHLVSLSLPLLSLSPSFRECSLLVIDFLRSRPEASDWRGRRELFAVENLRKAPELFPVADVVEGNPLVLCGNGIRILRNRLVD